MTGDSASGLSVCGVWLGHLEKWRIASTWANHQSQQPASGNWQRATSKLVHAYRQRDIEKVVLRIQ